MKQEHHPKEVRTNSLGASRDIQKEFSGAKEDGTYFDSKNGRVSSVRGNKFAWEKIRGEEIEFDANQGFPGDWYCAASIDIDGKIFEIWVEETDSEAPIIRIDGVVVGNSENMPWLRNKYIQWDKNESCVGGEVFLTDFNTPPMILNIGDMLDALVSDPTKYFTDFNADLYTVNLNAPLDIPVFTELVNVGGGGGLPVGSYQYSIRYVTDEGDRTNWGPSTPPIPVVQSLSPSSSQYPGTKTYGDDADVAFPTSFGIKLKFRVTNLVNYDFIEIRRISYNTESGIGVIPQGEIVAKIDVSAGEISVKEFVDPAESNVQDTLADSEDTYNLSFIEAAKSVRYFDKRTVLGNIRTASRDSDLQFSDINGEEGVPILENMGKLGHNDPYFQTYRRAYMSGERHGFAVNLFDPLAGRGFALPIPGLENFQFPNRRDQASADSELYSYGGMPTAANVQSGISKVFEVFDHENAVAKTDTCSYKNIMTDGSKSNFAINSEGCPSGPNDAGDIGYQPYRPVNENDSTESHNYRVNTKVEVGLTNYEYNPEGFGLNYYSKGIAIPGISNFPAWAKSFSIVRTPAAGRVVFQGIGMYALNPGIPPNTSLATKDRDKFIVYSPDIAAGLISQALLDDIDTNPSNYKVQVISPLGFFSELYNHYNRQASLIAEDELIDLMTYARIIYDQGQINPAPDPTMGVNDGTGKRYVAYNKYRNGDSAGGNAFGVPEGGNKLFDLLSLDVKTEGRGVYYELQLNELIYNQGSTGGVLNNDWDDQGMKDFTEPFYIINIVQEGRNVIDQNIDTYLGTSHYQKLESIIGRGDGSEGQSFELVDERWEDCIPDLSASGPFAAEDFFVYLVDDNGNERTFMDVTFLTVPQRDAISNDIANNGFYLSPSGKQVVGLYTHTNTENRIFNIVFDVSASFVPNDTDFVIVRYDQRKPLRVFGGDTTIGESIFAPIDREANSDGDPQDEQYFLNISFPMFKYFVNPRHYIVRNTTGLNKIQDSFFGSIRKFARLTYLRQLCVMFTSESRVSMHYAHNLQSGYQQYFPLTHYIMRPNDYSDTEFGSGDDDLIAQDNNMQRDYFEDYPLEYNIWDFGGLRFRPQFNIDYSVLGPIEYFSKPDFGFEEQNEFCTRIIWSLSRAVNQQDSPGLKTFPGSNVFDIDDDQGEIKRLWDASSAKGGDNLYSLHEIGVALLLTQKSILTNIDGSDIGVASTDAFVQKTLWLSKDVGSYGEMWRASAEASVSIKTEQGPIKRDAIYFPNNHSVYRLMDNVIMEIGDIDYFSKLNPVLSKISSDFTNEMTAVYNEKQDEYWMQMEFPSDVSFNPCDGPVPDERALFVFGQERVRWVGDFDYYFDKYVFLDNEVYGSRDLITYKLDQGYLINGNPITAWLIQVFSPQQALEKEAIDIQINTGDLRSEKPTRIEFYDRDFVLQCAMDEAIQGPNYLKRYDGWRNFVPRKDGNVSVNRERLQDRLFVCKIIHNLAEDFSIVDTLLQYKIIK